MNEIISDWLHALESGEYPQLKGNLTDGNCYCAIGLLAFILGVRKSKEKASPGFHFDEDLPWIENDEPPVWWIEKVGLKMRHYYDIITMNEDGRDFLEIARYIRENIGPSESYAFSERLLELLSNSIQCVFPDFIDYMDEGTV